MLALLAFAGAADAEGACPNEAIREEQGATALPDCRAYEMVSPPFKGGHSFLRATAPSSDGDKLIVRSLGDLAGAPGATQSAEGNLYLATRSPAEWQLSPLNAPESEFVGQQPEAEEANDGETLWQQHTPAQSDFTLDLYVRSSTGRFSLVGPLASFLEPEAEASDIIEQQSGDRAVAATSNFQHVVIGTHEPPLDTAETQLYEYTGTNGVPTPIGVVGEKGSTSFVGQCGAPHLGGTVNLNNERGPNGSFVHNALSADGETVFFTGCGEEDVPEVYARLHGSIAIPDPAETVDVSASECKLGTVACGEKQSPKNFVGASENGQRVFFMSTQRLTDEAVNGTASGNVYSCGATTPEGADCNLYEYDFSAPIGMRLRALASGEVLGVAGISNDGSRIYYVSKVALAGAGANASSKKPIPGQPNLYVDDTVTGMTNFIATLETKDESIWAPTPSRRDTEIAGDSGQFLLFASSTPGLTIDDVNTREQLFEYSAETRELVRVSKGEDGYNEGVAEANGEQLTDNNEDIQSVDFKKTTSELRVSGDGKTVIFESDAKMSSRALAAESGCTSVYEFRAHGTLASGSVHLISDGRDTQKNKGGSCGAQFEGMDATGANIFISTADPLVASDTDGAQRDIYDVREDGGFANTASGSSAECSSRQCGMTSAALPPAVALGSVIVPAGENLAAAAVPATVTKAPGKRVAKCKKGQIRRGVRCVRAPRKRKHDTKTSKGGKRS